MPEFSNFSSFPPNVEVGFIPFEERMAGAQQKSLFAAIFAGAVTFVLAIGIYLGVAPDATDESKDMNMSNLSHTEDTGGSVPASTPSAAPAPAPAADGSGSASAAPAAGSAAPAPAASGSGSASGSN